MTLEIQVMAWDKQNTSQWHPDPLLIWRDFIIGYEKKVETVIAKNFTNETYNKIITTCTTRGSQFYFRLSK